MLINIFTDSDLDQLAEATLSVLERAGVMFQSDVILDALEQAGATVDRSPQRARLPRRMIEPIVERQRKLGRKPAAPADMRREPAPPDGPLPGIHTQVAQFYYDHERAERRIGNRQDLVKMVQFGDALDERCRVDHVLLMHEEPYLVEPLEALLVLMEHTSRPGSTYPHFAAQFPYLEEIGEIYAGDPKRFLTGGIFMVSPLRMDRRACDYMTSLSRRGIACGVGTQPVSGVSAPVTRAGAIVVGAAEILAGWAASAALNPDLPLAGCICAGSVDMATANVTFCSPEAMTQDIGCVELFRRRFGGQVNIAGGSDYTSAKLPGYQAGFEKAFEAMAISAYAGGHPHVGAGLLDSGKMFSPLQLLIDREFQSFLWRFAAGAQVNEDDIALDLITSVGSGIGLSYLDSEHTLSRYRQSLWFPRLVDRSVWQGERQEENPDGRLLERAAAEFQEVTARYRPPEVDRDMLSKVRQVVDRARRDLANAER
jgi:trimethylamine--corrinoid protein Co-methyltransferase